MIKLIYKEFVNRLGLIRMRKKRFDVIEKENRILSIIYSMENDGDDITYYSVAKRANCTRNFLYNSVKLSCLIEQKRKLNYKMNFFGNEGNIMIGIKSDIPDMVLEPIIKCLNKYECIIRYIKGENKEEADIIIMKKEKENSCVTKVKINYIDNKVYFLVVFPTGENRVYSEGDELFDDVYKYYKD